MITLIIMFQRAPFCDLFVIWLWNTNKQFSIFNKYNIISFRLWKGCIKTIGAHTVLRVYNSTRATGTKVRASSLSLLFLW